MASLSSITANTSTAASSTSPTTFSGFNGFDFGSIINNIIAQQSGPMQNTQKQQQAAQAQSTALTQLGGYVGNLETTVGTLTDGTAFTGVAVNSSDATTVNATLATGAIPGYYDINIGHLARAQVTTATDGYANSDAIAADGGSLSFTINGKTTTPINITGSTSLAQLTEAINDQASGVVASIVNDGTNQRLVLSSSTTGQAGGFTINNSLTNSVGTAPAFAAGQNATTGNTQNAQDAAFTMNGLAITSPTNTVTDAISGVTLTLVKPGEASVNVVEDDSGMKGTLATLVSDYNTLQQFYASQSSGDPTTGQPLPLSNDPSLQQAMSDITNTLLGTNNNGGKYNNLSQVGIEFTATGTLSFNSTAFDAAMAANPQDVQALFQGNTTTKGVFSSLKTQIQNDDATTGLIATSQTSLAATIKNYQAQLVDDQNRLNEQKAQLTQMYAAADQAMTQLSQQSASLTAIAGR